MTSCPVCKTPNCVKEARETADFYKCSRCGRFALTGSVVGTLETYFKEVPLRAAIMSHTLRRAHRDKESPRAISTNELPSYWSSGRLPTPQEQADSLILWIGENQHTPAIDVKSSELALDAWIGAPLAKTPGNAPGLRWIVDQLKSDGLFRHRYEKGEVWFSLHLPGWNRYAALKQKAVNSRIGFMAMKFRDAVLDGVVRDHFKPAVAKTGFELRLLTDEQPAGLIDNQLRAAILSARFLIAITPGPIGRPDLPMDWAYPSFTPVKLKSGLNRKLILIQIICALSFGTRMILL
jgi:hypothetical protein